jgi:hypothetical protein
MGLAKSNLNFKPLNLEPYNTQCVIAESSVIIPMIVKSIVSYVHVLQLRYANFIITNDPIVGVRCNFELFSGQCSSNETNSDYKRSKKLK